MRTREKKLVAGYVSKGFKHGNRHYRPMTAETLVILEDVNSKFLGDDPGIRGVMDFLFVCSSELDVLDDLSLDAKAFRRAVTAYAGTLSPTDLEQLKTLASNEIENASAAVVEIKEDSGDTKKK